MTDQILELFGQIPGFYEHFLALFLIFARFMAFFQVAPIFRRKEFQPMLKVGISLMLTFFLYSTIDIGTIPNDVPFIYLLFMNITEGLFIGMVARMIFATIQAAGDLANNQMALSSASMFDPSSRVQTSLIGNMLNLFGIVLFLTIGGAHWLIAALHRSFEVFPVFAKVVDFSQTVPLDYWIYISGNIIFVGFQMVAPVIITTLAIDIILGIISKTAPQINVFQLSFVFKPTVGSMVLLATLPLLYRIIETYFIEHSLLY